MNLWTTFRCAAWLFLTVEVWEEAGPFTAVSIGLTFTAGEIVAWACQDLLREEGRMKAEEWKRKREAKR